MQQNIEGLLKSLANVPVDKLVEWYTARAIAEGYGDMVTAVACVLCACVLAVITYRLIRRGVDDGDGDWIAFSMIPGAGMLFAIVGAVANVSSGLLKIYAPQASAIDKFLQVVTK